MYAVNRKDVTILSRFFLLFVQIVVLIVLMDGTGCLCDNVNCMQVLVWQAAV